MNSYSFQSGTRKNPAEFWSCYQTDSKEAAQGLARKLPHYGKYSYLVLKE